MFRKLIFSLMTITLLQGNISFAATEQPVESNSSEKKLAEAGRAVTDRLDLEKKDEPSEFITNLQKVWEEAEKKNEIQLQKKQIKYINSIKKEFFKKERKNYRKILKVVFRILKPLEGNETCKGGQARVIAAAVILNRLTIIHKEYDYGSLEKRKKLYHLYKKAQKKLKVVQESPKGTFGFNLIGDYEPETKSFFSKLFEGKDIKIIGVNLGTGFLFYLGTGLALGRSKTPIGSRGAVLAGKAIRGCGIGSSATIEYNSFKSNLFSKKISSSNTDTIKGGFLFGGGAGVINETKYNSKEPTIEGGLVLGFMYSFERIGGFRLFCLPTDLKFFRKNVGITFESGKLPAPFKEKIEGTKNKKELHKLKLKIS